MTVKKETRKVKITQVKSSIGYREKARRTLKALGLRKIRQSVVHMDSPVIRGMISGVKHLVKVEELSQ